MLEQLDITRGWLPVELWPPSRKRSKSCPDCKKHRVRMPVAGLEAVEQ